MTYKAIETKFIGPTNFRGSRVKAVCRDSMNEAPMQVTLDWDHALDSYENHARAAIALCDKMGWTAKLVGGSTVNGYVFVRV